MNEYILIDIFMVIFSAQILNVYLNAFHKKSQTSNWKWGIWGIYIIFQYLVILSNASHPLLILTINVILVSLVYKFSYVISTTTAIFHSGIFYSIWMMVEVATNYVLSKTGITELPYGFIVGSAISKIVMYLIVQTLKNCHKDNFLPEIPLRYWIRLFLIPFTTAYVIHNTYCLTYQSERNFFFLLTTILMLLVNYVAFDVYDKLGKQLEIEKKNFAYAQQIELCNKQAAEREIAYQRTQRLRHNLTDYLVALKVIIQAGKISDAETKIDQILKQNQIYKSEVSRSGNLVIDSLINYKHSFAEKENIDIKCQVKVPEVLPFDGADLCIILGNLLDNAIEAVAMLPIMKRCITITISLIKENLCIIVQNPYDGVLKKNHNGKIETLKLDKRNHGMGLDSVQYVVDKYHGELLINDDKENFVVKVLIYSPEKLHEDS